MAISQFWIEYDKYGPDSSVDKPPTDKAPTDQPPADETSMSETTSQLKFLGEHEAFIRKLAQKKVFILEDLLVVISSVLFALILVLLPNLLTLPHATEIIWSGIFGLVITGLIETTYQSLRKRVNEKE